MANEYLEICSLKKYTSQTMSMKRSLQKTLKVNHILKFSDFNQKNITAFFDKIQNKYRSDTVKKYISEIKAFLNYAIKQGKFKREDYEKITYPKVETKNFDTVITDDDFLKIIENIRSKQNFDFEMYLKFLWYTGCRPSEAVNLKVSDIDLEKGTVTIYQNKTKKKNKTVIPKVFLDELNLHIQKNQLNNLLFTGNKQGREFYSKKFSKMKKRLDVNSAYTLYTFRHTFATNLINATGDLELVSRCLGHANIKTTAKHYINRKMDDRIGRINEVFK